MEFEGAAVALEDGHAGDVCRQQIAGELNPLKLEPERAGQGVGEGGLADSGNVLDEQVAASEQTSERQSNLRLLAEDDAAHLIDDLLQ
jgi:hypothetical protein